jgi:glucokinase
MSELVLAADIGGTKTAVALFELGPRAVRAVREERFASREHASFDVILARFLDAAPPRPRLGAVCVGIAGAVFDGASHATNLPWQVDEESLRRLTGAPRAKLLNDLEAAAFGMLFLPDASLHVLHAGTRPPLRGNVAVIAPGTGLGEAFLWWDGAKHHPVASEGGHEDFAPQSDLEIDLLRWLRTRYGGHVSWERTLSGPGLRNLYEFLRDTGRFRECEAVRDRIASGGDPNPLISELGLARRDELSTAALGLFARLLGAEAGNMAMRFLSVGGVFVGGGIAPKILPALGWGGLLEGFLAKGRFTPLMESIRVSVCLAPRAPLEGCAHYARELCEG